MKGHWSPFWVAIIIVFLSAFPNPIHSLTKFFLNGSFPLERPIFLINFDLSTVLCQHSADPRDLHSHELSILCDGKLDCFPSASIHDESFPYCRPMECAGMTCSNRGACLFDGQKARCFCNSGSFGQNCELSEPADCFDQSCHSMAKCLHDDGDSSPRCECSSGFRGNGISCEDIDECQLAAKCPSNSQCVNLPGAYFCNCSEGLMPADMSMQNCIDIDECFLGTHNCPQGTRCQNLIGSFTCVSKCSSGFQLSTNSLDGQQICEDLDECQSTDSSRCHFRAKCLNTPGSFECQCDAGFVGDGFSCTPVTDCRQDESICHPHAQCLSQLGICLCQAGYRGDGIMCEDVDECKIVDHPCEGKGEPEGSKCVNVDGGFVCCPSEKAENECLEEKDIFCVGGCGKGAFCKDGNCQCPIGFGGNPQVHCQDIDECQLNPMKTETCNGVQQKCVNLNGGHICCSPNSNEPECEEKLNENEIGTGIAKTKAKVKAKAKSRARVKIRLGGGNGEENEEEEEEEEEGDEEGNEEKEGGEFGTRSGGGEKAKKIGIVKGSEVNFESRSRKGESGGFVVLGGPLDGLAGNGLGEIENGQNGLGNGNGQLHGTKGNGEIEILERPTGPSEKEKPNEEGEPKSNGTSMMGQIGGDGNGIEEIGLWIGRKNGPETTTIAEGIEGEGRGIDGEENGEIGQESGKVIGGEGSKIDGGEGGKIDEREGGKIVGNGGKIDEREGGEIAAGKFGVENGQKTTEGIIPFDGEEEGLELGGRKGNEGGNGQGGEVDSIGSGQIGPIGEEESGLEVGPVPPFIFETTQVPDRTETEGWTALVEGRSGNGEERTIEGEEGEPDLVEATTMEGNLYGEITTEELGLVIGRWAEKTTEMQTEMPQMTKIGIQTTGSTLESRKASSTSTPISTIIMSSQSPTTIIRPSSSIQTTLKRKLVNASSTLQPSKTLSSKSTATIRPATSSPSTTISRPATSSPSTTISRPATSSPSTTISRPATSSPSTTISRPATSSPSTTISRPATSSPSTTISRPATSSPSTTISRPATSSPSTTISRPATSSPSTTISRPATSSPSTTISRPATSSPSTTISRPATSSPSTTISRPATSSPSATISRPATSSPSTITPSISSVGSSTRGMEILGTRTTEMSASTEEREMGLLIGKWSQPPPTELMGETSIVNPFLTSPTAKSSTEMKLKDGEKSTQSMAEISTPNPTKIGQEFTENVGQTSSPIEELGTIKMGENGGPDIRKMNKKPNKIDEQLSSTIHPSSTNPSISSSMPSFGRTLPTEFIGTTIDEIGEYKSTTILTTKQPNLGIEEGEKPEGELVDLGRETTKESGTSIAGGESSTREFFSTTFLGTKIVEENTQSTRETIVESTNGISSRGLTEILTIEGSSTSPSQSNFESSTKPEDISPSTENYSPSSIESSTIIFSTPIPSKKQTTSSTEEFSPIPTDETISEQIKSTNNPLRLEITSTKQPNLEIEEGEKPEGELVDLGQGKTKEGSTTMTGRESSTRELFLTTVSGTNIFEENTQNTSTIISSTPIPSNKETTSSPTEEFSPISIKVTTETISESKNGSKSTNSPLRLESTKEPNLEIEEGEKPEGELVDLGQGKTKEGGNNTKKPEFVEETSSSPSPSSETGTTNPTLPSIVENELKTISPSSETIIPQSTEGIVPEIINSSESPMANQSSTKSLNGLEIETTENIFGGTSIPVEIISSSSIGNELFRTTISPNLRTSTEGIIDERENISSTKSNKSPESTLAQTMAGFETTLQTTVNGNSNTTPHIPLLGSSTSEIVSSFTSNPFNPSSTLKSGETPEYSTTFNPLELASQTPENVQSSSQTPGNIQTSPKLWTQSPASNILESSSLYSFTPTSKFESSSLPSSLQTILPVENVFSTPNFPSTFSNVEKSTNENLGHNSSPNPSSSPFPQSTQNVLAISSSSPSSISESTLINEEGQTSFASIQQKITPKEWTPGMEIIEMETDGITDQQMGLTMNSTTTQSSTIPPAFTSTNPKGTHSSSESSIGVRPTELMEMSTSTADLDHSETSKAPEKQTSISSIGNEFKQTTLMAQSTIGQNAVRKMQSTPGPTTNEGGDISTTFGPASSSESPNSTPISDKIPTRTDQTGQPIFVQTSTTPEFRQSSTPNLFTNSLSTIQPFQTNLMTNGTSQIEISSTPFIQSSISSSASSISSSSTSNTKTNQIQTTFPPSTMAKEIATSAFPFQSTPESITSSNSINEFEISSPLQKETTPINLEHSTIEGSSESKATIPTESSSKFTETTVTQSTPQLQTTLQTTAKTFIISSISSSHIPEGLSTSIEIHSSTVSPSSTLKSGGTSEHFTTFSPIELSSQTPGNVTGGSELLKTNISSFESTISSNLRTSTQGIVEEMETTSSPRSNKSPETTLAQTMTEGFQTTLQTIANGNSATSPQLPLGSSTSIENLSSSEPFSPFSSTLKKEATPEHFTNPIELSSQTPENVQTLSKLFTQSTIPFSTEKGAYTSTEESAIEFTSPNLGLASTTESEFQGSSKGQSSTSQPNISRPFESIHSESTSSSHVPLIELTTLNPTEIHINSKNLATTEIGKTMENGRKATTREMASSSTKWPDWLVTWDGENTPDGEWLWGLEIGSTSSAAPEATNIGGEEGRGTTKTGMEVEEEGKWTKRGKEATKDGWRMTTNNVNGPTQSSTSTQKPSTINEILSTIPKGEETTSMPASISSSTEELLLGALSTQSPTENKETTWNSTSAQITSNGPNTFTSISPSYSTEGQLTGSSGEPPYEKTTMTSEMITKGESTSIPALIPSSTEESVLPNSTETKEIPPSTEGQLIETPSPSTEIKELSFSTEGKLIESTVPSSTVTKEEEKTIAPSSTVIPPSKGTTISLENTRENGPFPRETSQIPSSTISSFTELPNHLLNTTIFLAESSSIEFPSSSSSIPSNEITSGPPFELTREMIESMGTNHSPSLLSNTTSQLPFIPNKTSPTPSYSTITTSSSWQSIPKLTNSTTKDIFPLVTTPTIGSTQRPFIATTTKDTFQLPDLREIEFGRSKCTSREECGPDALCDYSSGLCHCKLGFTGSPPTIPCIDVNECTQHLDGCHKTAQCHNFVGGFACFCPVGFRKGANGECQDIDECKEFGKIACHPSATCHNLPGTFQCQCSSNFIGDGQNCVPSGWRPCSPEEWTQSNCGRNHVCLVNGQEGNRFDCSQCKKGFRFKNGICSDIDECKEPKGSANYHGCHPKAKCQNKIGFHLCQCLTGYAGDGRHCVDIDECKGMMGNEKEENEQIEGNGRNGEGKMEGELLENGGNEKEGDKHREKGQTENGGEIGKGQENEDRKGNRRANQTLRNGKGVGNRMGIENGTGEGEGKGNGTGGEGNNGRRIEGENSKINGEARKGNGKENENGEQSHNGKEGGRRNGNVGDLKGNGKGNGDEEGNGNNGSGGSGENQQIGNGRNRMAGRPNQNEKEAGKENQKWNGTVDGLDGRSEGNGQNGKGEENGLIGNETGGRGNGQIERIRVSGEDGGKRREGGGQWPQSQCHPQAICENLEGSHRCQCPSNWFGDGQRVCSPPKGICPQNCANSRGAVCLSLANNSKMDSICECPTNSRLDSNSGKCIDIDECAEGRHGCDPKVSQCINLPEGRGFECRCLSGFEGRGGVCVDIDECQRGLARCAGNCLNRPGTYICQCPAGYVGDGHSQCKLEGEIGQPKTTTTSIPWPPDGNGGPGCPVDWAEMCRSVNKTCFVDDEEMPQCGSCIFGFQPMAGKCLPVNSLGNCADPIKNDCHQYADCIDIPPGKHFCSCQPGFIGDGMRCDDVDECSLSGICDANAVCRNLVGSYECHCRPPFQGDGHKCVRPPKTTTTAQSITIMPSSTSILTFSSSSTPLSPTNKCSKCVNGECVNGMCKCAAGFTANSDGYCGDVDECHLGLAKCGAQAICLNLEGTYRCECPEGMIGDGRECVEAATTQKPPEFEVECLANGAMNVKMTNKKENPKGGRIFVQGQAHKRHCSKELNQNEMTKFEEFLIPQTECGLHLSQNGTLHATLVLQPHQSSIPAQSYIFNVECQMKPTISPTIKSNLTVGELKPIGQELTGKEPECLLEVNDQWGRRATRAKAGELLTLTLSIIGRNQSSPKNEPIFPRNCYAINLDNGGRYCLTDEAGCAYESALFPDWTLLNPHLAKANFYSFRWPETNTIRFECDCTICTTGKCPKADCERRKRLRYSNRRRFRLVRNSGERDDGDNLMGNSRASSWLVVMEIEEAERRHWRRRKRELMGTATALVPRHFAWLNSILLFALAVPATIFAFFIFRRFNTRHFGQGNRRHSFLIVE